MVRLLVIRHGYSLTNKDKRYTGQTDVPLDQIGHLQAEAAARYIAKKYKVDAIYSSDLCRAVETGKIAVPDGTFETDRLLREINVGDLQNLPHSLQTKEQRAYNGKYGYADYHGESREELKERIRKFMKKLEETDLENVALFSHGGVLRAMLSLVLEAEVNHVVCNNCAVAVFEYKDETWSLYSWVNLT